MTDNDNEKSLTEAQIIVKMREAIEVLKEKYMESEGAWALVDFMGAATESEHWMHKIVEAEKLSAPYMPEKTQ